MCKAHSKVIHIKQQKYFHHLKGRGYNNNSLLYPGDAKVISAFLIFAVLVLQVHDCRPYTPF